MEYSYNFQVPHQLFNRHRNTESICISFIINHPRTFKEKNWSKLILNRSCLFLNMQYLKFPIIIKIGIKSVTNTICPIIEIECLIIISLKTSFLMFLLYSPLYVMDQTISYQHIFIMIDELLS